MNDDELIRMKRQRSKDEKSKSERVLRRKSDVMILKNEKFQKLCSEFYIDITMEKRRIMFRLQADLKTKSEHEWGWEMSKLRKSEFEFGESENLKIRKFITANLIGLENRKRKRGDFRNRRRIAVGNGDWSIDWRQSVMMETKRRQNQRETTNAD